ncbi:MAG: DMT family transporter [Chloroflexi bacterium]|nr:DMT family transporter [Chloroflexota bacterium]MCI0863388.1 DMT family transporter [Chloroflexota bacterium]MCI0898009.1 DMT family transporter [Chloroflexota bacterium]MCI0899656.1 DMT family transporter [Chloroflexota bacterium]
MAVAVAFAFLAACGFASGNVLVRVGTQKVPPPTAALLTVLSSVALVAGLALALRLDEIGSLSLEAMGWILVMGIMAYPMARVLLVTAISMVGAARAVTMSGVQPVIAFALGVILLGERPDLLVTLGTPVIVAGLFLVVVPRTGSNVGGQVVNVRRLGYVLALFGAATFATRDVISRHVVSGIVDPLLTAGLALAVGAVILTALLHRQVVSSIQTLPGKYLLICALAGLFQGLAVASLFQALSRAPVTVVSPIYACTPLITLVLARIFLRRLEVIDWLLVAGTGLSVGGVILVIFGATR